MADLSPHHPQSDGSIDGRPEWLRAGRADLGAGTCTVDVQRSAAVYMGEWFWSDTTSIALGRPEHNHSDFLVFGVLTEPVWALAALYVGLFALLLRLAERIGRAVRRRGGQEGGSVEAAQEEGSGGGSLTQPEAAEGGGPVASLVDYTQQSVRMFLGQGDDVTSSLPATRLLMIFVYMVGKRNAEGLFEQITDIFEKGTRQSSAGYCERLQLA